MGAEPPYKQPVKGLNWEPVDHTCWKELSTDQTCLDQPELHLAQTGQTNGLDRMNAVNKTIKGQK